MTMARKEYVDALKSEWKTAAFYRDLLAEFTATFLLMTVQSALPASWSDANMGSVVQVALGMAAVVGSTAWTIGDFGGAYMNPAVNFSMMILGNITFIRAIVYTGIQCAACVAGASFINTVTPSDYSGNLAATVLHPDMTPWQGVLVEIWLTFNLVLTVHGATNLVRKGNLFMPTIIISMAVFIGVSCGFSSTGGSMNPARTLGPAVVRGLWKHHWIYWVGPLSGSALATFVYHMAFDFIDNPRRLHSSAHSHTGSQENQMDTKLFDSNGIRTEKL